MSYPVLPVELRHIDSFGDCVAEVARERRYLAIVEGFGPEQNALWVAANRARGNPLYVALDQDRVVGWCEVRRDTLPGREHSGTLGIGVRAPYGGAGLMGLDSTPPWPMPGRAVSSASSCGYAHPTPRRSRCTARLASSRKGDAATRCAWTTGREDELLMALFTPLAPRQ